MIYQYGERRPSLNGEEIFIAESADIIGSVLLEDNVTVLFGAVLRGDCEVIKVGSGSNIQDNAVLHADEGVPLSIGRNVTIGHSAIVHGCTIGDGSLVGLGAVILNGAKVGKNCLIGAKALVPEGMEIPDNSLVVGMPAKVKKMLNETTIAHLKVAADHYVETGRQMISGLKPV